MTASERVISAAAADLAQWLGGETVSARPLVMERAPTTAPPSGLDPAGRRALESLARHLVEAVLALRGRGLSPEEVGEALRREVHKRLMARPELERAVAARLEGALPRLLDVEQMVELAHRGVNASPVVAALDQEELVAGRSPAFRQVLKDLSQVAASDFPVLLVGESGTGKELLARRLHQLSLRREGPLVTVNCAAMPPSLLESELFGHEKGAFTGAEAARPGYFRQAKGGTLFLDEIGEAPPELQVRLLRVLENRRVAPVGGGGEVPVDFRLVAATHRDLAQAASQGQFNQALLYRLQVVPLYLPPLRERPEDLDLLLDYFLAQAEFLAKKTRRLAPETKERLRQYAWPGNVRELRHLLQRLVVLSPGFEIGLEMLPPEVVGGGDEAAWRGVLAEVEGIPAARVADLAAFLAARQGREVANQDLRGELECSDSTAKNILSALTRAGLATASGSRGGRRYRVGRPGA
ncbi:MAG: sigma-54 dependent transcriptional regulator [Desulfarculus sp.]|nr:sigma-54 dependent transcriptional regulator [Pseudomonadota bacterium]MBV1715178.1 sigma-54 dependent transcriptional regulator [Desulfarculus sp.]MBU4573202.1 sigma-54 dependent transcriptional regulator [Pseudomonadota bacterium]MBU4598274.1 sigma-54 dependent transcriptional regulator [Pseudomonadota bacterium]MBV1736676.1 sigma-54 dependent transcriptional regulator [Desulfarculus sp.]